MTAPLTRRRILANVAAALAAATFTGSRARASAPEPHQHRIEISRFKFAPHNVRVAPGDTITWVNLDIAPHTATAIDGSWDTGTLKKGETGSVVVTRAMSPSYFCRFHPVMKDRIELVTP